MLSKSLIDQILLGPLVGMRFTQDSAVLPEVWTAYSRGPGQRIPLLLTPYRGDSAGRLARRIAELLDTRGASSGGGGAFFVSAEAREVHRPLFLRQRCRFFRHAWGFEVSRMPPFLPSMALFSSSMTEKVAAMALFSPALRLTSITRDAFFRQRRHFERQR